VIDYAVAGLAEELEQRFESLNSQLEQIRQRKRSIEEELDCLVGAIASGQPSKSLMSAIGEREEELRTITDRLLEPGPASFRSKLETLKTVAVSRLTNLRKLIAHPDSVNQARAALAEHFGSFILDPTGEPGETSYSVRGEVDFFGPEVLARAGGAGGPACMLQPPDFLPHPDSGVGRQTPWKTRYRVREEAAAGLAPAGSRTT
jgi:hypothetical protein